MPETALITNATVLQGLRLVTLGLSPILGTAGPDHLASRSLRNCVPILPPRCSPRPCSGGWSGPQEGPKRYHDPTSPPHGGTRP